MAQHERPHDAPPANKTLQWAAGILLMIPVIAILWVSSYSKVTPKLGPFPFFIWYQTLWVFGTAVCTTLAYVLVQRSRTERPRFIDDAAAAPATERVATSEATARPGQAGDTARTGSTEATE